MATTDFWDRFDHDPRVEDHRRLRAADRDRDLVNDVLASAYSEGRLSPEELDERSSRVAGSKTLGELTGVVDDLVSTSAVPQVRPSELREEAEHRWRQQRQQALTAFLVPTLICWVVWISVLLGGGGTQFPWPLFVTIGTGAKYFRLANGREDHVRELERQLVEERRKEIEAA